MFLSVIVLFLSVVVYRTYLGRALLQFKPHNFLIIILAAATHHSGISDKEWIRENGLSSVVVSTLWREPELGCPQRVLSQFLVWWHKCRMGCHWPSASAATRLDIYQIGQLKRRTFSEVQEKRAGSLFCLVLGLFWPFLCSNSSMSMLNLASEQDLPFSGKHLHITRDHKILDKLINMKGKQPVYPGP